MLHHQVLVLSNLILLLIATSANRLQLVAGKAAVRGAQLPARSSGHGSRMAPLAPPREILVQAEPLTGSGDLPNVSNATTTSTTSTTTTTTTTTPRPAQEISGNSGRHLVRYGPSAGNYQLAAGDIEAAGSSINEIMASPLVGSASRRQVLVMAPLPARGQQLKNQVAMQAEASEATEPTEAEDRDEDEALKETPQEQADEVVEPRRGSGALAKGNHHLSQAASKSRPTLSSSSSSDHKRHEDEEAQARREQEAAEASEAELADRSALDEQRQAQREIILAQAQSEAKAIKEQQDLLLKQQLLQQQMISRRHNELEADRTAAPGRAQSSNRGRRPVAASSSSLGTKSQQRYTSYRPLPLATNQVEDRRPMRASFVEPKSRHSPLVDSQFSDQLDSPSQQQAADNEELALLQAPSSRQEVYDYSLRHHPTSSQPQSNVEAKLTPTKAPSDLQAAAQHLYGAHYDTLGAHHQSSNNKNYFQFAESYKGGQFHSGYKRGGRKLQKNRESVSGHSSQHKNHAEGHIKWKGKKGKGSSYWDYQHGPHSANVKHHYYSY